MEENTKSSFEGAESTNDVRRQREILDFESVNLLEILEAVLRSSAQKRSVVLPKFNPDLEGANAVSWCSTTAILVEENKLNLDCLVIALSAAMEGTASLWLSEVIYPGITWAEFKDIFIQRYGSKETPAAMFLRMLSSRPNEGECLSAFANRMVTSLMKKWRTMKLEEIAVSVTLAQLANADGRLQRLTSNVRTRSELQAELTAFDFNKRKNADQQLASSSDSKRPKMETNQGFESDEDTRSELQAEVTAFDFNKRYNADQQQASSCDCKRPKMETNKGFESDEDSETM